MTAASCLDSASSMRLDAALIVLVTFLSQVTVPFRASSVSVWIRSSARRPLGLLGGGDDLVEQADLLASVSVAAAAAACGLFAGAHDLASSVGAVGALDAQFGRQFLELVGVLQDLLEQVFEVFGAVDLGQQVAELVAGLQQLPAAARPAGRPGRARSRPSS